MSVNSPVHLVLHCLKKSSCSLRILVIVKGCGIKVSDFLIKFTLRKTNLTDILQLSLKIFIREHMPLLQTFLVHCPALDGIILYDLPRPFTEANSTVIINLETNSNNHLEIIVNDFTIHLTQPLGLNYPEFPDSCFFSKFTICIYLLNMLIHSSNIHIIKGCHHLLCQPYIFVLIAHFKAILTVTNRSNISKVFSRTRTDCYFLFFLFWHDAPPPIQLLHILQQLLF